VFREFTGLAFVGEVGGIHHEILAHFTDYSIESFFVGFASHIDVATLEVFAWPFTQREMFALAVDVKFLIHSVHHISNPSPASFQKSHPELRKEIEHAVENDARELDHLCEPMFQ